MVRWGVLSVFFPLLVAGAAGCGGSSPAAPAAPTLISDTFTGTVGPLGADSRSFNVVYSAGTTNASITVTSLVTVANQTPVAITIGVGFGTLSGGLCTPVLTNPVATIGAELATTTSPFVPGTYCVLIFDNQTAPTIPEPLTYSLTVNHY
jgi:hypothetical protein